LTKGILYKGSTENLEKRINYHNQGKVTFTSKYTPWELVFFVVLETSSYPLKREKCFKAGAESDWIKSKITFS
jgi:putative endonuclease